MTPTREQLIEGRDEALDHLGIDALAWERMSHVTRRNRAVLEATRTPTGRAAAMTVALAEEQLALGVGSFQWQAARIMIAFTNPMCSRDVTLAA